jgi:hypothetical protein
LIGVTATQRDRARRDVGDGARDHRNVDGLENRLRVDGQQERIGLLAGSIDVGGAGETNRGQRGDVGHGGDALGDLRRQWRDTHARRHEEVAFELAVDGLVDLRTERRREHHDQHHQRQTDSER